MGVILPAVGVVIVMVLGAFAAHWLERGLLGSRAEAGAAFPVRIRPDAVIEQADRWMYPAGPVSALFAIAAGLAVIPFSRELVAVDLGIGVFYFIVVIDFTVLGLSMGGWGANTPFGTEVYYRAVAQLVAYVIPLGLAYIGAIMMAGSLSTVRIVEAQSGIWFIVVQPIGFVLYVITAQMQAFRAPFLEPFSSKIDYGVLRLYGGWKAWAWRVSLSGLLFAVSAMGAVLFLGGWHGPWLPGPVWMLIKTFAMMVLLVGLGARFRPLTTDEMLQLSWKILTPVGLANVLIVGGLILLGVGVKG